MATEKVRLRIGSLAKAVLVTGQAYQDPKDALNEFISNAADEYAEADRPGERIRVILRRKGRYPVVAVDDDGRGMTPDRLREVARNLFKSVKVDDERTLGEKAIGLLAFQQLDARCDIVSRVSESSETWLLRLTRGAATAELRPEKRRARATPGTTVYVAELDREILRSITQRKVVDYLRRRRGAALEAGEYSIEVQEGRSVELVTPEQPEGIAVRLAPHALCGGPSNSASLWLRAGTAIGGLPLRAGRARRSSIRSASSTSSTPSRGAPARFRGASSFPDFTRLRVGGRSCATTTHIRSLPRPPGRGRIARLSGISHCQGIRRLQQPTSPAGVPCGGTRAHAGAGPTPPRAAALATRSILPRPGSSSGPRLWSPDGVVNGEGCVGIDGDGPS